MQVSLEETGMPWRLQNEHDELPGYLVPNEPTE